MKVHVLLLVVCCFASVFGTSRLFVDEITGVSWEAVHATNVHTDLLIADYFTVDNGVTADAGSESHYVSVHAPIVLNVGTLNVTSREVDILSYGQNVAFHGQSVDLSASGDFTINSVDFAIVSSGDITGNVGGTFGSFGTIANIKASNNITLAASGNIHLSSSDRIFLQSDLVSFDVRNFQLNSAESNVFLSATVNTTFASLTGSLSFTAASGLSWGSSHGLTSIEADYMKLSAENFVLSGRSFAEFNTKTDLLFQTESIAGDIWFYTERILFEALNFDVDTVFTFSSNTVFESAGNFQMRSNGLSTTGDDIVVLAVDALRETAGGNINFSAENSTSILAANRWFYGGADIEFESRASYLSMLVNGEILVNAVNNDIIMDSPLVLHYLANNIDISASDSLQIESHFEILRASTVDFYSFTSMTFNAVNANFDADNAGFASHENTLWTVEGNAQYTTLKGDIRLISSGDIEIRDSANHVQVSQGSTEYTSQTNSYVNVQTTSISSGEDIKFDTLENLYISAADSVTFVALDDWDTTSDHFHFLAGSLTASAPTGDVTFRAKNSGGFDITANTDLTFNVVDELNFAAQGNVAITTQFGQNIVNQDTLGIYARNVAMSFHNGQFFVPDDTVFTVPEFFSFIQGEIGATDDIRFFGDDDVKVGTLGGIYSVNTFDYEESVNGDIVMQSANLLHLAANVQISGSGDNIFVESDTDKDLVMTAGTDMFMESFDANVNIDSSNIVMEASNVLQFNSPFESYTADKRFSVDSTGSASFTSQGGSINIHGFGELLYGAENDVTIDFPFPGGELQVTANKVLDFFINGVIDTGVTASKASLGANDVKFYLDTWTSDQRNLFVQSTDTELFFDSISINLQQLTKHGYDVSLTAERVLSFDVSDVIDVVTTQVTFAGGDIYVQGGSSITLTTTTTTTGDISLGSTKSTTANPNYDIFSVQGQDFTGTSPYFTMFASGREEFQHVAIWLSAGGSTTYTTTVGDFETRADNGIYFKGTNTIDSTSVTNNHDFIAGGQIAVYAQGANAATIEVQSVLSSVWQSLQSGMTFRAFSTASFQADFIDLISNLDISMQSLEDSVSNSDISFLSTAGDITFTGNDMSVHAGRNEEYTSDILVVTNSKLLACSVAAYDVTGDITIRALGDQVANQGTGQVNFNGGTSGKDSTYNVLATNRVEMFPSGLFRLTTQNQGELHMDATGELTLGSGANRFDMRSLQGLVNFNSARDWLVQAGGVNGQVLATVTDAIALTAGVNYESYADGTIQVAAGGALSVTATTDMWFNSTNPYGGVNLFGVRYLAEATGSGVNADLTYVGQNVWYDVSDTVNIDSPIINFGQANVFSPQLVAHVSQWNVLADGNIDITTSNDNFIHQGTNGIDISATVSGTITAGGAIGFYATDPDDSLLSLDAFAALSGTAALFVEAELGSGDSLLRADGGLMFLKSSGSKNGNGILIRTRNNVEFNSVDLVQTFSNANGAKYTTGTGVFDITTDFASSSQSLTITSDNNFIFSSTSKVDVNTQLSNSRIELTTEGVNSDIEFGVTDVVVGSGDDFFVIANKVVQRAGDNQFIARGSNSGKIIMSASDLITFGSQLGTIQAKSADDIIVEATGEDSLFGMSADNLNFNTPHAITLGTEPAEGGSIRVTWGDQTGTFAITSLNWDVDLDGDATVTTPGSFTFAAQNDFETSAGGYSDVTSENAISFSSSAQAGNVANFYFTAEAANIQINSALTSTIAAGAFGAPGSILSNTQSIDVTVRGNGTASTSNRLSFTSTSGDAYIAASGDITETAYSSVDLAATGTSSGTGFIEFLGNDISVTSTHAGGDIHFDTVGCHFGAPALSFLATGTDPEKGFIKIVNDLDKTFDSIYWYTTVGSTDIPTVHLTSGAQTTLQSLTGNIRGEYSRNLMFYGGDISMIAGRSIEWTVRGDGRLITNTFGHIDRYAAGNDYEQHLAMLFKGLSAVQFRTNGEGHIKFQATSGDILAASEVSLIRSDIADIFIESSGSVSFLSTRQDLFFKGVAFESNFDIRVNATDGDINFVANVWRLHSSSLDGVIQLESPSGSINIQTNSANFDTFRGEFTTDSGDINVHATGSIILNANSNIDIQSNEDIYITYRQSATFFGHDQVILQTFGFESYYLTPQDGIIRFTARQPDENEQPVMNYNAVNPTVQMPNLVTFNTDSNYYNFNSFRGFFSVETGGWCPFDRLIGFGQDAQAPAFVQDRSEALCVCLDNVWMCSRHQFQNFVPYNFIYDTFRPYPRTGPFPFTT